VSIAISTRLDKLRYYENNFKATIIMSVLADFRKFISTQSLAFLSRTFLSVIS